MKIVIVGGVASGMSAATRLRRLNEDAEIIVFEMTHNVSYANCGLPYFIGDVIEDRSSLLLQTPQSLWKRFRLDVRVAHKVLSIDRENRHVSVRNLQTGSVLDETYDYLVLATGAKPRVPNIPGVDRAMTLRTVEDADAIRAKVAADGLQTAAIIGAGFVGLELAENLRHLGLEVTLVQRASQILPQLDPEMVAPLEAALVSAGVRVLTGATLESIGESTVTVDGNDWGADLVFAAAGVVPDNDLATRTGLRLGPTGGLWVDAQNRTSDPHVFAAGDAVEKPSDLTDSTALVPLANLANRHGRLIADAISGREPEARPAIGTAIIGAFGVTIAVSGLTEKTAKTAGIPHLVVHVHPNNHAGYYPGATKVSLKLILEPESGRLLGAQAFGHEGVDKRIDVLATAIRARMTATDLIDLELAYAPQFGSAKDAVNIAGYVAENVVSGVTPTIQWHELDGAIEAGATVIDVRSPKEHAAGRIPNTINISVDELRERLDEIPNTPLIVYCAVGQRGHIATQLLKANGFEVRNLDGGFATWASVSVARIDKQLN